MRAGKAGYSLFEVLVAFVILSLVLTALIPDQARLLGRASATTESLLATDFALSRLDSLGVATPIAPGRQVETYRNWTVETDIRPTVIDGDIEAVEITLRVLGPSGRLLAEVPTIRALP